MFSLNANDIEEFLTTSSANIHLCLLGDPERHWGCEPDQEIVNMLPSLHFPSTSAFSCLISQPSSMPQTVYHVGRVTGIEMEMSIHSEYWKYGGSGILLGKNCTQLAVEKLKFVQASFLKDHLGS